MAWLGLTGDLKSLTDLQTAIEGAAAEFGFPPEIALSNRTCPSAGSVLLEDGRFFWRNWTAYCLATWHLRQRSGYYKSDLIPSGAFTTALKSCLSWMKLEEKI